MLIYDWILLIYIHHKFLGGSILGSRDVVHLFFKTLGLGGIIGLITSFFVNPEVYATNFSPFDSMELFGLVIFYIGFGLLSAVVSQTGFFAYLYIHRFGLGFFRSYWSTVQMGLIAFVIFDLIYFPYRAYNGEVSIFWFILMSFGLLAIGLLVAWKKSKETNQIAFVPALFLMVVITTIEWVPGLQSSGIDYAVLMIVTLLVCNAYQLFALHRLSNNNSNQRKTEPKSKQASTKKSLSIKK